MKAGWTVWLVIEEKLEPIWSGLAYADADRLTRVINNTRLTKIAYKSRGQCK